MIFFLISANGGKASHDRSTKLIYRNILFLLDNVRGVQNPCERFKPVTNVLRHRSGSLDAALMECKSRRARQQFNPKISIRFLSAVFLLHPPTDLPDHVVKLAESRDD